MTVRELIAVLKVFPENLKVESCVVVKGEKDVRYHGAIYSVGLSDARDKLEITGADYDLLEND